jgi:hypothetical protein
MGLKVRLAWGQYKDSLGVGRLHLNHVKSWRASREKS